MADAETPAEVTTQFPEVQTGPGSCVDLCNVLCRMPHADASNMEDNINCRNQRTLSLQ